MSRRLLLVHAHPDDETLTTGGTIARYAADGVEVHLVTCTLGEEGEVIPPELAQLAVDEADQLGGYRAAELAAACAELGVGGHSYLGGIGCWRDSGMAGTPSTEKPRAFVRGSLHQQVGQLQELLDAVRPQVVVTYDGNGGYGHPDHIRAHEVTMAACGDDVARVFHVIAAETPTRDALERLRGAPFTVPNPEEVPTVPDDRVTTTISVAEFQERKLAGLRAHRTQVAVDGDAYALSNGVAVPNPDAEYFELARGSAEGAADDLFGGL